MEQQEQVWVFSHDAGGAPAGIFRTQERAEAWIRANRLTGMLKPYPLDEGFVDEAMRRERARASRRTVAAPPRREFVDGEWTA